VREGIEKFLADSSCDVNVNNCDSNSKPVFNSASITVRMLHKEKDIC
jgi:hypothetical protein